MRTLFDSTASRFPTRREWLRRAACGFGSLALTSLALDDNYRDACQAADSTPAASLPRTHFPPHCRHVIFLYMDGGPSQVDTFDPKPRLQSEHGKPFTMKVEQTQFNNNGNTLGSPWKFEPRGQSGIPISELFPHVAKHADDLAVIRSMTAGFSEHTNANYFLHTGLGIQGRPSMGAWFCYGLGSECRELPGFVVLNSGLIPPGGLDNFNSGFLPATYQASLFHSGNPPVANIDRTEPKAALQENKLALLRRLDRARVDQLGRPDPLESAIVNYELAFKMQTVVPQLTEMSDETAATREAYGLNATTKGTALFGRQCLLARRLVEKGVRFIELTCPSIGHDRWDQHSNLKAGHGDNALAVDQPIGALLADLKQRGLFDQTLVVWSGEFGRTPFAQGSDGRDHNPFGFSLWLAGGEFAGAPSTGPRTNSATKRSKIRCKSTICMRRCSIFSASTIRVSPTASVDAMCG